MRAQFDTECPVCDGSIRPGDAIAKDSKGRWVCYDCATGEERAALEPVAKPICKVCRCEMPCWCDDGGQPEDAADQALRRQVEHAARDPWETF